MSEAQIALIDNWNAKIRDGVTDQTALNEVIKDANKVDKQYFTQLGANTASTEGLAAAQKTATASTIGLQAASIALNAVLTMGVAFAIQAIIKGIDYLIHRNENLIQSAKEVTDTYREQAQELSGNVKSLQEQKDEFERLSKGVDEYGNNISLSTDEYSRYKDIVAEILGCSPELIAGYDEEGNAIAKKNGLIEQSIALMKEEQKQKLREVTSDENTETLYKGAKSQYNEQRSKVESNNVFKGAMGTYARLTMNNGQLNTSNSISDQLDLVFAEITGRQREYGESWTEFLERNKNAIINNYDEIHRLLTNDFVTDYGTYLGMDTDGADQVINWLKNTYDSIKDLDDLSHGMDDQFMAYAQRAADYDTLTDAQKNFVKEYIRATGSILDADGNFLSQDEITEKARAIERFAEELATNDELRDARKQINELFSIDKEEFSAADYEDYVDRLLTQLQKQFGLDDDAIYKIKLSLGFEFMEDGSTRVDTLVEQVQEKLQDEFDDKVAHLRIDDLVYAAKVVAEIPEGQEITWDELVKGVQKYKHELEQIAAMDAINKNLDDL